MRGKLFGQIDAHHHLGIRVPTERHSSPVEAVLTGSRVALLGLVEILMGPRWGHGAINQG